MKTPGSVVHSDPEILGGTPVFVGTRVPVKSLIDYLEAGHPLTSFSTISRASRESRPLPRSRRRSTTWFPVRVLLDECVPKKLRRDLVGHDVRTVTEMGWSGTRNGRLLRQAETQFDVFLTVDQGMSRSRASRDLPSR